MPSSSELRLPRELHRLSPQENIDAEIRRIFEAFLRLWNLHPALALRIGEAAVLYAAERASCREQDIFAALADAGNHQAEARLRCAVWCNWVRHKLIEEEYFTPQCVRETATLP